MKKVVLYGLAGLLILLVAAVLIGPGLIDWNAHKGRILAAIEERTGRAAAIDGDIDLTILPAPALRVAGVRIANFDGAAAPDMLRLKELRLRVSIGALLEGRIAVEQLDLIEPVVALEVAADGSASWDLRPTAVGAPAEPASAVTGDDERIDISLASVTVQNGTVSYRDTGSGRLETLDGLNMTVSAPSLAGPFAVSTEARYRNLPVTVEIKTGTVNAGQPVTIGLTATLPETGASLKFNGRVSEPGSEGELTGSLVLSADNADRLAAAATGTGMSPLLAQPVSLEGGLTASRKAIALNDARLRFGDTLGNGAVNVSLGDTVGADIAISVNRVDLDKLLSDIASDAAPVPADTGAGTGAASDAGRQPDAPATPAPTLPANVNATLDLGIEAIQYRGEVIRQAGIRGTLANGAVTLDHASALLPGGSDVSVIGFLQTTGGTPKFDGDVAVASDNLRGMLKWLGADMAAFPADRLRGFSYAGKLSATPQTVQIPDFNLRLDTSTIRGALAVALRDRVGFGLRLDIDQLNLDAYFPPNSGAAPADTGKPATSQSAGAARADAAPGPLALLESFDANIDARLERLTYKKTLVRNVSFDGQLVGGTLTMRKFDVGEVAGTRIGVAGTVQGLSATPRFAVDFDVAVNAPDQLFRALDKPMPILSARLGKPSIKGRATGGPTAVTVDTTAVAAGATLRLAGPVDLSGPAPRIDLTVGLDHPDLTTFVRLFDAGFNPAAEKLGPLKAGFGLTGSSEALSLSAIDMTVGPVAVQGKASLRLDGPKPVIDADLATSEVLLDLFQPVSPPPGSATARGRQRAVSGSSSGPSGGGNAVADRWSREPIDFSGLQALDATVRLAMAGLTSGNLQFEKPQVDAALKDGRLDLRQFTAGLFGGNLSGKGNVDSAASQPGIALNLSASGIDMARAATAFDSQPRVEGPLSINAALTTAGTSEAALVSALSGEGAVTGKARVLATRNEQSAIGAVGLASALFGDKVKELQQVGGLTTVLVRAFGNAPADLSGNFTVRQGVLQTRDTVLRGSGAAAATVASVDLPRWTIESNTSVLRSGDSPDSPYVTVSLSGSMDAPNVRAGGSFLRRESRSSDPLKEVLPGIVGGDGEKPKPQDILRGLLKGLGK